MTTKYMESKYSGKCICGASFKRGAIIQYNGGLRKVTACPTCRPDQAKQGPSDKWEPDYSDIAYEDQCAARCGL
jgi:hypothetical protein